MFVGRRPDSTIYGTWTCPQPQDTDHPGMEELPDDHPDVVAFQTRPIPLPAKSLEERVAQLETSVTTLEASGVAAKISP